MSNPHPSPRSPPRRARPPPHIPAPYLAPTFSAAAHALHLIDDPAANIQTTLVSLRLLRDHISASLHSTAPPWHTLTPAIASLNTALRTTQSATALRNTLASMQHTVPPRDDYPARMSSVVRRAAQLSANVALASAVRDFAHLLRAAEVPDSSVCAATRHLRLLPTPAGSAAARRTFHSTLHLSFPHAHDADASHSPHSPSLPNRFLQRAAALHRARAAASTPPLIHVVALDDARASLARQHATLQSELETALVDAIFSPVDTAPADSAPDPEGPHTFTPVTSPRTASVPTSPLPQDVFPSLVQAVDLLGGPNRAASVLCDTAPAHLVTLVRNGLLADPAPPPSTIASIQPSSFNTSLPATHRTSAFQTSPVTQSIYVFDSELTYSNRLACSAVFERVRVSMTAVLRRLSTLAEAVDCENSTIFTAVRHIWKSMEATLVSFVHALLAFPSSKPPSSVDRTTDRSPGRISLLPETQRNAPWPGTEPSSVSWELERAQTSLDSFTALVNSVNTLTPSIYNLEVVYSPLQQFIMMSTRLQQSWKEGGGTSSPNTPPAASALSQVLKRAVDLFMRTVRRDVCKYMQNVLGNRAGTLLQPLSRRQRRGAGMSGGKTVQGKDVGDGDRTHVLPLLAQTQMIMHVVASCISLGVAVPSIAGRIGDVVNHDVIVPFCKRALYALELVSEWSDSGVVFDDMWSSVVSTEGSNETEGSETSEEPLVDGRNRMGRSRALACMRNEAGLTTKCWGRLCEREPWRVHNTRVLLENEWNAVVRVVANAKLIISELESCVGKGESSTGSGIGDEGGRVTDVGDCFKVMSLRSILRTKQINSNMHGPVVEAVQRTQMGCRMLREEVIERGLMLLHCEVVLFCFSRVVKTLSEDVSGGDLAEGGRERGKRKLSLMQDEGSTKGSVDVKGSEGGGIDMGDRGVDGIINGTGCGAGNGLSRPSSIFKALPIQLSDVERTSDEESWGMNEFDEFGDRITITNEAAAEPEIEECGFPNSLLLEQDDWKGTGDEDRERAGGDGGMVREKRMQTVTKSDRRAWDGGRAFGEEVKRMDECVRQNLGGDDWAYVKSEADEGVGLGIRMSGAMRAKGDRDVATGARLLMDSAATVAADTLGWPVVESDYSVAEDASHSASECRTLLFAAGML